MYVDGRVMYVELGIDVGRAVDKVLSVSAPIWVVFEGPVLWTGKKTETEPNATESNRTVGCSCPHFKVGWVASCLHLKLFENRCKTG